MAEKFDVGGVLLDRPFAIRRLGHFGFNAFDLPAALRFYGDWLGLPKIVDDASVRLFRTG